jgi:colicin import membrane protein
VSQRIQTDEGYSAALFWSVVLHAAIVLLLASRFDFGGTRLPEIGGEVIEAVVVDASVLEQKKRRQAEQAAAERRRQEAERKAAEERKLQAEQERLKAEQERKLALQRQEAEKKAAEQKRLQEQRQKEEAARKAEEKRRQDEARKAEERAQLEAAQKREQEQMQAEAAAAAQRAAEQKQLASAAELYALAIQQKVQRHWIKPPYATSGQTCRVLIRQIPGGEVISVEMRSCDGDAALQRSVEQAIYMASPLPEPPDPRVFARDLAFTFRVP